MFEIKFILFHFFCLFSADSIEKNEELEFERNKERFLFLKVSNVTCTDSN